MINVLLSSTIADLFITTHGIAAAFNSNQQIELQENSEVHSSSNITTLSKEGRSKDG